MDDKGEVSSNLSRASFARARTLCYMLKGGGLLHDEPDAVAGVVILRGEQHRPSTGFE